MDKDAKTTSLYWDEVISHQGKKNFGLFWWQAGPEIGMRFNRKISGDPNCDFIEYTLKKYFEQLPLEHCLVLGCGTGELERNLAKHKAFIECDAFDISEGSIAAAKKRAFEQGISNIHYMVSDINQINLPSNFYNAVWIKDAMHHFKSLEHVCREINKALKPDGLLILFEYIGPSRFQFPSRQKEIANHCLMLLPKKYRVIIREAIEFDNEKSPFKKGLYWFFKRLYSKVKDGTFLNVVKRRIKAYKVKHTGETIYKEMVTFPSIEDVISVDPSEAIRSGEIIEVLQNHFEILEKKDLGGNIIQFLLSDIAGNFSNEDDIKARELLKMLINIEETLLISGEFESDYAFIVAK